MVFVLVIVWTSNPLEAVGKGELTGNEVTGASVASGFSSSIKITKRSVDVTKTWTKLPFLPLPTFVTLVTLCYPYYPLLLLLPFVTLVTPCYPLLPLLPLLPLVTLVTPCYPCYPLLPLFPLVTLLPLSLIHIWRCRRSTLCRSRWSPYH